LTRRFSLLSHYRRQLNNPAGFERCIGFINRRKAMKLIALTIAGLAVIASPVLAQAQPENTTAPTNTTATETTHVKTTTRQVHATNVPVRKHHHAVRKHHHAMRCSCPPTHMKAHHRHVVKKTTTTQTTTKTPG
jgi:hypothetical protein